MANGIISWPSDLNGDGLTDLLVHVDTPALELSDGDTEAFLTGSAEEDADGIADAVIRGVDTVRVAP